MFNACVLKAGYTLLFFMNVDFVVYLFAKKLGVSNYYLLIIIQKSSKSNLVTSKNTSLMKVETTVCISIQIKMADRWRENCIKNRK